MSKFKHTFDLRQHTPIIHFQSHQSGATLRATELKPKFDKFLKKYFFNNDKELYKKYLIKNQEAFDYKVKIYSQGSKQLKYKTYISRKEQNNKKLKIGSYFGDFEALLLNNTKVEIFTFHTGLLEIIVKNFEKFLVFESFGTRNNKGFGNFTLSSTTKEIFEKYLKYYFDIMKIEKDNDPLKYILHYYQELKGGVNKPYKRSKLMLYFYDNDIRWEKRWIKRKLYENHREIFNNLKDEHTNGSDFKGDENYYFVRALLGLPNQYEFQMNRGGKLQVIIESVDNIDRFPSPIIHKVFEKNVYILLHKDMNIKSAIFDKTFKFKVKYNGEYELGKLKTPSANDFNIKEFLKAQL